MRREAPPSQNPRRWGTLKFKIRCRTWATRRFYDFNVWSRKKKIEKLAYMHMNPVKRGLVARPDHWIWSSCKFYEGQKETLIRIDPVG